MNIDFRRVAHLRLVHGYYPCESGCCGYDLIATDARGIEVARQWFFKHPRGDGSEDIRGFVEDLAGDWAHETGLTVEVELDPEGW